MLSAMVKVGVNLNHEALGCTAIELAINTNNPDVVKTLFSDRDSSGQLYQTRVTHKENPDYVLDNGDTLLISAIKSENFEAEKALIELGADINMPGTNAMSPVQHAIVPVMKGVVFKSEDVDKSIKFFEHILEKGADAFHQNQTGTSLKNAVSTWKNLHKTDPHRKTEVAEKTLIASFAKKGPGRWKTLENFLFKPTQQIGTVARIPEKGQSIGKSKAAAALETIKICKLKGVVHTAKITTVKTPQKSRLTPEQQQARASQSAQKPRSI
jgi:hypothetical protein